MKLKITSRDVRAIGFQDGPEVGLALELAQRHYKHTPLGEVLALLTEVYTTPETFVGHDKLGKLAERLVPDDVDTRDEVVLTEGVQFRVFGREGINDDAIKQMALACQLPISVAGALMSDGHVGYSIPIGGVLACDNAVIPVAAGSDIGCSVHLSVLPINEWSISGKGKMLEKVLRDTTRFGRDEFDNPMEHEVIDRPEFNATPFLRGLKDKAFNQLGTSGQGNHFVNIGVVELLDDRLGLHPGRYLGIMSHSGSRNLGAKICDHYTAIAKSKLRLPRHAGNLAWLDLAGEAGIEYWLSMRLAGDYALACHEQIHYRVAKALGEKPAAKVVTTHNLAWREQHDGRDLIVHRKGATPARKGELAVIPSTMASPSAIVIGLGNREALDSASHGAGRSMSRAEAKDSISRKMLKDALRSADVHLVGGGLDEAPQAYKDFNKVMSAQAELVERIGWFEPRVVRMCDDGTPAED